MILALFNIIRNAQKLNQILKSLATEHKEFNNLTKTNFENNLKNTLDLKNIHNANLVTIEEFKKIEDKLFNKFKETKNNLIESYKNQNKYGKSLNVRR